MESRINNLLLPLNFYTTPGNGLIYCLRRFEIRLCCVLCQILLLYFFKNTNTSFECVSKFRRWRSAILYITLGKLRSKPLLSEDINLMGLSCVERKLVGDTKIILGFELNSEQIVTLKTHGVKRGWCLAA